MEAGKHSCASGNVLLSTNVCFPALLSKAFIQQQHLVSCNKRMTLIATEFWLWSTLSLNQRHFWVEEESISRDLTQGFITQFKNQAPAQCNYTWKTARGSECWWAEHISTEHLFWQQRCSGSGISQRHKPISSTQNPIWKAAGRNDATLLCREISLETNTSLRFKTRLRHPGTTSPEDLSSCFKGNQLRQLWDITCTDSDTATSWSVLR